MTYWALLPKKINDGVVLSAVPNDGPKAYKYDLGEPLLKNYPDRDEAIMVFDSVHYPEQNKLYDILPALDTVIVVNGRVKNVLDNMDIDNIEYLPIRL